MQDEFVAALGLTAARDEAAEDEGVPSRSGGRQRNGSKKRKGRK